MFEFLTQEAKIITIVAFSFAVYAIFIGILAILDGKKNPVSRQVYTAIGLFCIGLAFQRVFFTIHDYFVDIPIEVHWMNRMACFSFLIANTFLCYIIEKKFLQQTHFLFSILGLLAALAQFVAPFDLADSIHRYGAPVLIVLPFIVYIHLFTKTTGALRKQVSMFLIGGICLLFGSFIFSLMNDFGWVTFLELQFLRAIFNSIGIALIWFKCFKAQLKD
jgi:hypothetical protein